MGIDAHSIRFLREARQDGVNFGSTITLGCQSISEAQETLSAFTGVAGASERATSRRLFEAVGCTDFHQMDHSDYEGADVAHDLNVPLRSELESKFDIVFDGGTLEHVFNVAEGLRSCMRMLKVGGHFIGHSPANNWFGHGFYQFSPEFFWRAFSPENGFEILRLVAYEPSGGGQWFEVRDPREVGERIELMGPFRVLLLVLAKKVREVPPFQKSPAQSDYAAAWDEKPATQPARNPGTASGLRGSIRRIVDRLPSPLGRLVRTLCGGILYRNFSMKNTRHFTPVSPK
jgi:SAM-dependent methyltransferase